jgi:hypothetical protein
MRYNCAVLRPWRLVGCVLILLAAAWARVYRLDAVPPGWRDDEVIETTVHAALAATGLHLYFPQAEGHEPLYHYLSAGWMALLGRSLFSVRLLSAFLGVLSVAALYRLARGLFGAPLALLAAAGLALSFWGLMYARFKLRHVSEVVFMLAALALFLRLAGDGRVPLQGRRRYLIAALAGLCLALTLYTYYAARVVPVILLVFAAYLWLFHRPLFRARWRALALAGGVAALLTLPLAWAILQAPGGEERLAVVGQPLLDLLRGDPRPALRNTLETLGMFAFTGDPEYLYNIPGRPVFGWGGALLFVVGVLVCLRRWRDPRHAFVLLWLLGGLAPAFLSVPSASLGHTIAAQPVVFILPALGVVAIREALMRAGRPPSRFASLRGTWSSPNPFSPGNGGRRGANVTAPPPVPPRSGGRRGANVSATPPFPLREGGLGGLGLLLGLLYLSLLAARDLPDYFVRWPALAEVRYLYRADLHAAAPALRALSPGSDLALTSRTLHPADALALGLETPGLDLRPRVFSPERAWLFPGGDEPVLLRASAGESAFGPALEGPEYALVPTRLAAGGAPAVALAARFENGWQLDGFTLERQAGPALRLRLYWRMGADYAPPPARPVDVLSGTPLPLRIFSHVLDAAGGVLAGEDRLDVDPATLRPGDSFVQLLLIALPADAAPGAYPVQIGLYDPASGARVPLTTGEDALRLTTLDLP